jgi:ABC-type multidrug transport system fused ATPase/permease subunit
MQLISVIVTLLGVLIPGLVLNELTTYQRLNFIVIYICVYALYTLCSGIVTSFLKAKISTAQYWVMLSLEETKIRKNFEIDFAELENPHFHDIYEKSKKFLDESGVDTYFNAFVELIGLIISLLALASIISILSVWIMMVFVGLVIVRILMGLKIEKRMIESSLKAQQFERGNTYFGNKLPQIKYAKEVRINGLKDFIIRKFENNANKTLEQHKKTFRFMGHSNFVNLLLDEFRQAVSYTYLIYLVINNNINIGLFTIYLTAMLKASQVLLDLSKSLLEINEVSHYFNAYKEYLDIEPKMKANFDMGIDFDIQTIEFINVSFKYPNAKQYSLRNVNLKIRAKEKLAIVGENGAGKTTFVKLLCRLYDPTEGVILLNGIDIKSFSYEAYMKVFAPVFQDFKLLSFTLKENIAFNDKVDDEEIKSYLHKAGFKEKLENLERGIDTAIHRNFEEKGFEPSGGEGQKLALARALYKDSIVILDEPTAALDPRAEFEMYSMFGEMVTDKMAVFISHRLSSIKFCDRIAVFTNKKINDNQIVDASSIVELGTHNELIAKKGLYKELFEMQAQFYR